MAIALNGTTGISGVDGSASAPALQGTDSNTGINFGSDTVNINTGGSTRATVNSSGNVGINQTSPTAKLHIVESASTPAQIIKSGTSSNQNVHIKLLNDNEAGELVFGVFGSAASTFGTITAGDGVVSSNQELVLNSQNSSGAIKFGVGSTPAETMRLGRSGSHAQIFMNCTESFTSAMLSLQTNGTTGIGIKAGATNGQRHISFRNPNGEVGSIHTDGSSTNYYTSSDYRLKENEVAISDGISRLKTLIPYRFNFKADATTTVDGFFAHEVTAVPEAITGIKDEVDADNNPIYQGIDQSKLVPLLTAALQEAIAKIETLETKVAALEAG